MTRLSGGVEKRVVNDTPSATLPLFGRKLRMAVREDGSRSGPPVCRVADAAAIYDELKFAGVRFVTLAHGEIDRMKIALIELQRELFLKDVAFKTRRGQHGSVAGAKSAGGVSYGIERSRVSVASW